MRKLPGTESASYHVSTFLWPSLSMLVVFCTNVAVLYQDFACFFCIAWMSCSAVVILTAKAVGASARMKLVMRKTRYISNLPVPDLIEFARDERRLLCLAVCPPRTCS